MADVRALLAAERQSRRIVHPHLTYSKTGALTCNICNLNVKSEQLWPGHVKSLNHRKNAQRVPEPASRPAKRKLDSLDDEEPERNYEVDSRKKPKPAPEIQQEVALDTVPENQPEPDSTVTVDAPENVDTVAVSDQQLQEPTVRETPIAAVDEDEWAAFEREVAEVEKPDYASATIEAAPVSATELAGQKKTNAVQQKEEEADAEKEDEGRRMEEEFEVMEEMEDRLKRLRERREALRTKDPTTTQNAVTGLEVHSIEETASKTNQDDDRESSDEDDEDDWYG